MQLNISTVTCEGPHGVVNRSKNSTEIVYITIKSKLDYGNFMVILYTILQEKPIKNTQPDLSWRPEINPIDHRVLKKSPVEYLYTETNEAPPIIWSNKLALRNYVELKSCLSNSAYDGAFNPEYRKLFERVKKAWNFLTFEWK